MCAALAAHCGASAAGTPVAAPAQELFLEVTVNGEATGRLLAVRQGPEGFSVNRADLRQLGLNRGALAGQDETPVRLDAIAGLAWRYDAATQSLALTVDDSLRTPLALSAGSAARARQPARATPGAIINYSAALHGGSHAAGLAYLELRAFNERGVFSSSGVASATAGEGATAARFIRHDSFWVESDDATLRSLRVGDTITSSLAWNRALRIGGLQWSKSFGLRPDLATYPTPSIAGSAAVPSSLNLYVNGVQQYAADVPGGPFILNHVAGVNGAGEATLITRDPLGRATSTSLPLYVDARMLAAGLSEYSVEGGVARRGFGTDSFGYRGAAVATASFRYGWSDALTVEGHAELAPRLMNAGAGGLLGLGRFGVLSANLAASGARIDGIAPAGAGGQAGLGYQYVAPRISIDLASQRATRRYADLSSRERSAAPRATDRAALAVSLAANLSISSTYAYYRSGDNGDSGNSGGAAARAPARIVSLGLTHGFSGGVFASLSLYQNTIDRASRGVYLSVSMALGERSAGSVVTGRQNGVRQQSVSAVRSPDMDGGSGWAVQDSRQGGANSAAAQWQYLGRYGQLGVTAQQAAGRGSLAFDANGALVLMDGFAAATRSVGAGFALVSTGEVGGVPVLHENRVIGRTDASGHLLVPDLNPNVANTLSIDTLGLAVDRRVPLTTQAVNPRALSGLLVAFPVETYRAANVLLVDAAGVALPAGLPLLQLESGKRSMVGFDGLAFVDGLQAHNRLEVERAPLQPGGARCQVSFDWRSDPADPIPTIGPLRCLPVAPASAPASIQP